jgi:hypothetical protein
MAVKFDPGGWSDPAREELTPIPMVNNAMASVHAAITKAFSTAV